MQYHVSRDGHQLGSVSEADLKAGLGDGRYFATDLVWRDGMAQWTPLGEVLGLPVQTASPSAGKGAGATAAPSAMNRGPGTGVSPAPAPRYGARTALPMMGPAPASGLAVTALVSGIISVLLCGLGGIATLTAIITGHIALSRINRSGGAIGGRGKAATGLALGYASIVTSIIGIAILASLAIPVFARIQERGNMTKQISYARQLQVACQIYAADNGGKYPDSLEELVEKDILEVEIFQKATEFKVPGWEGDPGFEYRGAGKDDSMPPNTITIISNAASRRGERIAARHDGSAQVEKMEH